MMTRPRQDGNDIEGPVSLLLEVLDTLDAQPPDAHSDWLLLRVQASVAKLRGHYSCRRKIAELLQIAEREHDLNRSSGVLAALRTVYSMLPLQCKADESLRAEVPARRR